MKSKVVGISNVDATIERMRQRRPKIAFGVYFEEGEEPYIFYAENTGEYTPPTSVEVMGAIEVLKQIVLDREIELGGIMVAHMDRQIEGDEDADPK